MWSTTWFSSDVVVLLLLIQKDGFWWSGFSLDILIVMCRCIFWCLGPLKSELGNLESFMLQNVDFVLILCFIAFQSKSQWISSPRLAACLAGLRLLKEAFRPFQSAWCQEFHLPCVGKQRLSTFWTAHPFRLADSWKYCQQTPSVGKGAFSLIWSGCCTVPLGEKEKIAFALRS